MLVNHLRERRYIPEELVLETWEDIKPYADELESRAISSLDGLAKFIDDQDELYRIVYDEKWRRNVDFTCNTADPAIRQRDLDFSDKIWPELSLHRNKMKQKILASEFSALIREAGFSLALKNMQADQETFCEKNLDLIAQEDALKSKATSALGGIKVPFKDQIMTVQQAARYLSEPDRDLRESAWGAIKEAQSSAGREISLIFDDMVRMRHQIALNAGFANYRDYMFRWLKRHDYGPQECYDYRSAVQHYVTPFYERMQRDKAAEMGIPSLKPHDLLADAKNRPPVRAFETEEELIERSLKSLNRVDSDFHDTLAVMVDNNCLDLMSRDNKRVGGYQLTFFETNLPFIFANLTGDMPNVTTMMHETGHAAHDMLMQDLHLMDYKEYPMEMAELASMSLEFLSMDHWDVFFPDPQDLIRAKKTQLERVLRTLVTVAQLDGFQHEVYLQPELTPEQRNRKWLEMGIAVEGKAVDWSGLEHHKGYGWQQTTHAFTSPFYYIEYGFAMLGALQVWRNYKQDPDKTLKQFKQALSLGYTKSIPEVYETAGVKFGAEPELIKELMQFVEKEYDQLVLQDNALNAKSNAYIQPVPN